MTIWLRFIDPKGCGCADCIVGEAVPLDQATDFQIKQMLAGRLISRVGSNVEVTFTLSVTVPLDEVDAEVWRALKDLRDYAQLAEAEILGDTYDL